MLSDIIFKSVAIVQKNIYEISHQKAEPHCNPALMALINVSTGFADTSLETLKIPQ